MAHKYKVVQVPANHWQVRWNNNHIKTVDLPEFKCLGISRSSHACQFVVQTEIVLKGSRSKRLAFVSNVDIFLGFNRLMNTARPSAPGHGATCVLIDNNNLTFSDDVIHIPFIKVVRFQGRTDVVKQRKVSGAIKALTLGE